MICKRCNGNREIRYEGYGGAMYPSPCPRCRRPSAEHELFFCFLSRMLLVVLVGGVVMFRIWSDIMVFSPEIP